MKPLDRAMTSSYRTSVLIMSLSAAVWPQLGMQSFCLQPPPTCAELPYRILALIVAFDIAASLSRL